MDIWVIQLQRKFHAFEEDYDHLQSIDSVVGVVAAAVVGGGEESASPGVDQIRVLIHCVVVVVDTERRSVAQHLVVEEVVVDVAVVVAVEGIVVPHICVVKTAIED